MSRPEHHAHGHELSPSRIGNAEHFRVANCRVLADNRLDFCRVDIFTARDDHVLDAVENIELSVGVHPTSPARNNPSNVTDHARAVLKSRCASLACINSRAQVQIPLTHYSAARAAWS